MNTFQLNFTAAELQVRGVRVLNTSYPNKSMIHISVCDKESNNKKVIKMPYLEFTEMIQDHSENEEVLEFIDEVGTYDFNNQIGNLEYSYELEFNKEVAMSLIESKKVAFDFFKENVTISTPSIPMQEDKTEYYEELIIEDFSFHGFEAVATAA